MDPTDTPQGDAHASQAICPIAVAAVVSPPKRGDPTSNVAAATSEGAPQHSTLTCSCTDAAAATSRTASHATGCSRYCPTNRHHTGTADVAAATSQGVAPPPCTTDVAAATSHPDEKEHAPPSCASVGAAAATSQRVPPAPCIADVAAATSYPARGKHASPSCSDIDVAVAVSLPTPKSTHPTAGVDHSPSSGDGCQAWLAALLAARIPSKRAFVSGSSAVEAALPSSTCLRARSHSLKHISRWWGMTT